MKNYTVDWVLLVPWLIYMVCGIAVFFTAAPVWVKLLFAWWWCRLVVHDDRWS